MTTNYTALQQLLGKVFERAQDGLCDEVGLAEYERRRHEFVFHMVDSLADLHRVNRLLENPEGQDIHETSTFLIGFLYHVIPHFNAAGRLLLDDIPDPFAAPANVTEAHPSSQEK